MSSGRPETSAERDVVALSTVSAMEPSMATAMLQDFESCDLSGPGEEVRAKFVLRLLLPEDDVGFLQNLFGGSHVPHLSQNPQVQRSLRLGKLLDEFLAGRRCRHTAGIARGDR